MAKKKLGDDLVSGTKKFFSNLFSSSKKKVPKDKQSPMRKYAENKAKKKKKILAEQKESTSYIGKKADATVDPRIVKKKKPKKGPIVTKEQLAKSGLSLRDYMNYQQGKTRRDGPVVKKKVAPSAAIGNTKSDNRKRNTAVKMYGGGKMKMAKYYAGGGTIFTGR